MKKAQLDKKEIVKKIIAIDIAYGFIHTCLRFGIDWKQEIISDFLDYIFYFLGTITILACIVYKISEIYEKKKERNKRF